MLSGAPKIKRNLKDDKLLVRKTKSPQKRKEAPKKRNHAAPAQSNLSTLRPDTHAVRFYYFAY